MTGRQSRNEAIKRRGLLQNSISLICTCGLSFIVLTATAYAQGQAAGASDQRPNILVIFGDDIGQTNISAYSFGVVGYKHRISIASPTRA